MHRPTQPNPVCGFVVDVRGKFGLVNGPVALFIAFWGLYADRAPVGTAQVGMVPN